MSMDIVNANAAEDWLVTGWFTPEYRPLAETFAAGLRAHGAPFHLYAKPAQQGWSTRRKPAVVLEALGAYPGKTVVLADVDCIVQGNIAPVADIRGDVGITVLGRNMKKGRGKALQHWVAAECSSRVVVFHPTDGARTFLLRWADVIDGNEFNHDEHSKVWAFLKSPDVRFEYIAPTYSGREVTVLPDAILGHDSARHKTWPRGRLKRLLRALERPFRTGRTSKDKVQLQVGLLDGHPRLQCLLAIVLGVGGMLLMIWRDL
jgi:hypothetical protein